MSAQDIKAQPVDLQIANAIQWLDSDNHPHVADDMRDARKTVAALVEALKGLSSAYVHLPGAETRPGSWHSHAIAALKAAGVEL